SIGAHLATTPDKDKTPSLPILPEARVDEMEAWIDAAGEITGELRNFVLPGGSKGAGHLHVCRTVCRRAERGVVTLSRESPVDPSILIYLNRLSDYLFAASRLENHVAGTGDVEWKS
ncbi:MAG: ATP:cob(I)alamin adenosyltransferase, partial [Longimicrobiales bacterium]